MIELPITGETKLGALLDAYPELEETLIAYSPKFKKLTNPVLRRTIAKVATLAQAAKVGQVDVRELVSALRAQVGQDAIAVVSADAITDESPPSWLDEVKVQMHLDADDVLAGEESPLAVVGRAARSLIPEQAIEVTSSFRPEPLLESLGQQGFPVFCRMETADRWVTMVKGK